MSLPRIPRFGRRFSSLSQLILLQVILQLGLTGFARAQVPQVEIVFPEQDPAFADEEPEPPLIGEQYTFTVFFDNVDNAAGYGPYLLLCLPLEGVDGPTPCDGATFVRAEAVFTNERIQLSPVAAPVPFGANTCDPGGDFIGQDPYCAPDFPDLPTGCQLVVLELPFGSFFPDQPRIRIDITIEISELADTDDPLEIFARGGFRFGNQPAGGQCITTPAVSAPFQPLLYTLEKLYLGPEDETATGRSFPQSYEFRIDIAEGQTLDPLIVEDVFPDDLEYLGSDCVTVTKIPNGQDRLLQVDFGRITGTASDVDISCQVDFWVPKNDAQDRPTIGIDTCEARSTNVLQGRGAWDPIDPRDASTEVKVDSEPHELRELCLAIQKEAELVQDMGDPGPTPGDIVQYTISFQVSEYVSVGDLKLWDTLPDGLRFLDSLRYWFLESDYYCSGQVPLGPNLALDEAQRNQCGDGSASLHLELSQDIASRCFFQSDGVLSGTYFPPYEIGTFGQITFQAEILDEYFCPGPDDDGFVDKHDELVNRVRMEGILTAPTPGLEAADGSDEELVVPFRILEKKIIARNGAFVFPGQTVFDPGDTVTFSLVYTLPSGDAEALRIQDFLPAPALNVPTITGPIQVCTGNGLPADGEICYGPFDDLHPTYPAKFCDNSSSWSVAGSNSLCFDYGDVNHTDNKPRTVELRFTLKLTDEPFDDGLLFTNQVVETEQNSAGQTFQQVVIEQFTLRQPDLKIHKGVVQACCPYELVPRDLEFDLPLFARRACRFAPRFCEDVFEPQNLLRGCQDTGRLVPPLSKAANKNTPDFDPPGGGQCPDFDSPVTSSDLDDGILNQDIQGVKPGDRLTFAIVVENVGSSSKGAFDLALDDILPPGLEILPNTQPCVANGAREALDNALVTVSGNQISIRLEDEPGTAALGPYDPNSGRNVLLITFDARVTNDLKAGTCIENRTELASYAGVEGGPNHVAAHEKPADVARLCNQPAIEKSIVDTSASWTTAEAGIEQVTIGEIVRFRFEIEVPEGSLDGARLEDRLPPGLVPASPPDVSLTTESDRPILFEPALPNGPTLEHDANQNTITLELGRITNSDNDCDQEKIVVELNVQALNVATLSRGTNLANTGRFSFDTAPGERSHVDSNAVTLEIVEPEVVMSKSAELVPGTPRRVKYRIQLTNVGDSIAFELRLLDQLPACLTPVANSLRILNAWQFGPGLSVNDKSLDITLLWLSPGETIEASFEANLGDCSLCSVINNARVTYQGLFSFFQPGLGASEVPGAAGEIDGARDGSGGINDYRASASATIDDCAALIVVAKGESAVGCDRENVSGTRVTLSVSGGSGGYRCEGPGVLVSESPEPCIFIGMPFGTHTYGVTDLDSGQSKLVTVTVPPPFSIHLTTVNPSGSRCDNGSAAVDPEGGTSPHTVRWMPVDQTEFAVEGLRSDQTYRVLVTDDNGCRVRETFMLDCRVDDDEPIRDEDDWAYFRATSTGITANDHLTGDLVGLRPEFSENTGLSLGIGRRIAKRWSLDLGALWVPVDTTFAGREASDSLLALTFGLSYRLVDRDRFDLSIGPLIGWLDLPQPGDLKADGDWAVGAALGLDVPIGSGPWGLSGTLRVLETEISLDSPTFGIEAARDLSIFSAELGLRYAF